MVAEVEAAVSIGTESSVSPNRSSLVLSLFSSHTCYHGPFHSCSDKDVGGRYLNVALGEGNHLREDLLDVEVL